MKYFSIFLILFTSCGYQFQGSGSSLPEDINTVYVARVENNTTYSGVELRLREALRDRFERYRVVSLVEQEDQADAIAEVKIADIKTRVADVTGQTDIALEKEIFMTVDAVLKRANGQVLWRDSALVVSESIASTSDVVVTSSSDFAQGGIDSSTLGSLGSREVERGQSESALDELTDEVARKIYLSAVAEEF